MCPTLMEMDTESGNPEPLPKTPELTAEQKQIYDRQIRLWGAEAQSRLTRARLLFIGDVLCPLSQEISKNVVLAGVSKVTFVQECPSHSSPGGFLGNDLKSVTEQLVAMNPMVRIDVMDYNRELLAEIDIVCSIGRNAEKDRELAVQCKAQRKPLLCGRVAGFIGWFHLGLGNFTWTPEDKEARTELYPRFDEALEAPWKQENKRSAFGWHMASTLLEFEKQHGRMPGQEEGEFNELYKKRASDNGAIALASDDLVKGLDRTASVSLPGIAAIVGGVWGREVVKVLAMREEPMNNLFMYDARTSVGAVEKVGCTK